MTFGLLLQAVPDPARRLAAASYTIYLWHPFAVYPLRDAMRPAAGELAWDALILPWLAGLVLPLALLALARRTLGERATSTWLGERPSGR